MGWKVVCSSVKCSWAMVTERKSRACVRSQRINTDTMYHQQKFPYTCTPARTHPNIHHKSECARRAHIVYYITSQWLHFKMSFNSLDMQKYSVFPKSLIKSHTLLLWLWLHTNSPFEYTHTHTHTQMHIAFSGECRPSAVNNSQMQRQIFTHVTF